MRSYWENHYDHSSVKYGDELLKQVGKTVNGVDIAEDQVELIVESTASILELNRDDVLIDLCCGNGILTKRLAHRVERVLGVDFSSGLIQEAKRHSHAENIIYLQNDVLGLPNSIFSGKRKVLMYEALQHFSESGLHSLMQALDGLDPGSTILFGSIPDKRKLRTYYDTDEKYSFFLQREAEGRPHMGMWWTDEDILRITAKTSFEAHVLPQVPALYTSHYRFNTLLKK